MASKDNGYIPYYVVCGEESGRIDGFLTLEEAKNFIKELKAFDKRNNIQDTYYIEEEEY